ncbi:hypothetical protein [Pokkaliibacter plantistimulans]|uniref:hypothetical protein n=1 Tax=Pokkaliibacter plantistimulans TaxID=1635171 RepID=UPI0014039F61|nr:hypothetical protein [Pokkaliibacter plantistimulans]
MGKVSRRQSLKMLMGGLTAVGLRSSVGSALLPGMRHVVPHNLQDCPLGIGVSRIHI